MQGVSVDTTRKKRMSNKEKKNMEEDKIKEKRIKIRCFFIVPRPEWIISAEYTASCTAKTKQRQIKEIYMKNLRYMS